ncbi:YheC/YheD family protein [Cohnella algarum]|uniref:YheC/YheD family protein n=1 Tax=Cohnella algarum TaxID=2044859 RepID=UPI001967C2BD|nr:YheC/YheD family protein [Cohnella algarum]
MLIGVYYPESPLERLPGKRLEALAAEAVRQHVQLVFFDEKGVDLKRNLVKGQTFERGRWTERELPLPSVVIDEQPRPPADRSPIEQSLSRRVTFASHAIQGKLRTMELLQRSDSLRGLLIPTAPARDASDVLRALEAYGRVVLKPDNGRQGEGIVAVEADGLYYRWLEGFRLQKLDFAMLDRAVRALGRNGLYLVQPYINCVTEKGEPFDFRIRAQRNGEGGWTVTRIYPRLGQPGAVASNSRGRNGRTIELEPFLKERFPQQHPFIERHLRHLALEIAACADGGSDFPLDELEIDLTIDEGLRTWFYEADMSPQAADHEPERAVHTIAYAKRIAARAAAASNLR